MVHSLMATMIRLAFAAISIFAGTAPAIEPDTAQTERDARFRRAVVGTWEDEYKGHRTMTLKADGTGTMVVKLSGLQAWLAAPVLRFDVQWSIANGRLKKRCTGGEPAGKVNTILRLMGDTVDEPILELTEDRLLLLDGNGKTRYDWRRVKPQSDEPGRQTQPVR